MRKISYVLPVDYMSGKMAPQADKITAYNQGVDPRFIANYRNYGDLGGRKYFSVMRNSGAWSDTEAQQDVRTKFTQAAKRISVIWDDPELFKLAREYWLEHNKKYEKRQYRTMRGFCMAMLFKNGNNWPEALAEMLLWLEDEERKQFFLDYIEPEVKMQVIQSMQAQSSALRNAEKIEVPCTTTDKTHRTIIH